MAECTCRDWTETIGLLIIARRHWTNPTCPTHTEKEPTK
jgi:hypothetical protein